MMSNLAAAIDFADDYFEGADAALVAGSVTFEQFEQLQKRWSQMTFGPRSQRGPTGPLKHLQKEIPEMLEAVQRAEDARLAIYAGAKTPSEKNQLYAAWKQAREELLEELVDGFFLLFDAAWRSGHNGTDIRRVMAAKLRKNMARTWPVGVDPSMPVEHDRSGEVAGG